MLPQKWTLKVECSDTADSIVVLEDGSAGVSSTEAPGLMSWVWLYRCAADTQLPLS